MQNSVQRKNVMLHSEMSYQ